MTTDIPARLDRLPWSHWHWRVVIALGITWVLDGLEVTIVGAVAGVLGEAGTLGLSEIEIGTAASAYLCGAIVGALFFGRLTDKLGRKKLFLVTLFVYLGATVLTAFSWGVASFIAFRALTGFGIGGECAAMNSAIDELLPARVRGQADLAINGTYWAGTALGSITSLVLLNPRILPHSIGWRLCFLLGAIMSVAIALVRRHVPESPRWLLLHGRAEEAETVVSAIEEEVALGGLVVLPTPGPSVELHERGASSLREIGRMLFKQHPRRTALGLCLMATQAFAYNAIFFTYALVLGRFYHVDASDIGYYLLPFSLGNLTGPLVLGPLFDSIGRKKMIAVTYALAGALLWATGYAFSRQWLTAETQTLLWCAVFFVASAAASSAYLTVSEIFPVEMRGMAIAIFYSVGTAIGGVFAPAIFGALIQSGSREAVYGGYVFGAILLMVAGITALVLGLPAERKSLEAIAHL